MNKIKLLHEVVSNLSAKEEHKGELNISCNRDGVNVLTLKKEFEKNTKNGNLKAKISIKANCPENKLNHESITEFNINKQDHCCIKAHKMIFSKLHNHQGIGPHKNIKHKLHHIAFALNILYNLNVEEKSDKVILTLDKKDIINSMQSEAIENIQCCSDDNHKAIIEHIKSIENKTGKLTMVLNKKSEIESINIDISGNCNKENKNHKIDLNVNINLG